MIKQSFTKIIKQDMSRYWALLKKGDNIRLINKCTMFLSNPILLFIVVYRLAYFAQRQKWPIIRIPIRIIYLMFTVIYGNQISLRAEIGGGLLIVHWGGIVINGQVVIGDNCTMMHNVTIGFNRNKAQKIGNDCYLGAGAVIIGDTSIGDNVRVGANALVNKHFNSNVVIGGVPARVLKDNVV